MISKLRLLIALFTLGALPLWAQDGDAVPGNYFRTLGAGVTANDLYFSLTGKDKNISITDSFRSILYDTRGAGKLVFYKIVTGPDGKKMHVDVAQANISQAGSLALLIFSADPNIPGAYSVEVLPDDLKTFPLGSYRIFNRSSTPVRVILGKQQSDVAPNEVRVVIYPLPPKAMPVPAQVYAIPGDNTQRLLYANTWGYGDKFRTDILISPRPGMPDFVAVSRLQDNPTTLLHKEYLPKD